LHSLLDVCFSLFFFFFSSRRRHTRWPRDWSSDVCSSDLKKFQYEIEHPSSNHHGEMLNALLNAYIGCVDDAADTIQLGIEKQEDIRKGIDLMASRTKEFLPILQKYSTNGPELEIYKDNLDDAIEGTQDAMNDAEKAKKKVAPPPVRRKH